MKLWMWENTRVALPRGLTGMTASQEAQGQGHTSVLEGMASTVNLPDSRNTPLCSAARLSANTFFHVKPLATR